MVNLRKLRVSLGVICLTLITLLFLDFTGTIHAWLGWLVKLQFVAAVTAAHIAVIILWVALTLLFGRIYCSVICPLGLFQDVVANRASKFKKFRYRYSKALSYLRITMLVIFIGAFIAGIGSLIALLEPYSIYGRIASNIFAPFWAWGNNLLAYFAERVDSYAFYSTDVWLRSLPTFIIAAISLIIITILAWRDGRTYCNTICPVGTVLGFFSKFSLFKPRIDIEKCNSCGLCERSCKSSCIDSKSKTIDYSRCVTCLNCTVICKRDAMHYSMKPKAVEAKPEVKVDKSKLNFIATSMVLGSAVAKAQEVKMDGGLAVIVDKKVPNRDTHILPPGAVGLKLFKSKCTGCQLCVSVCPSQLLRPSTDLERFMQPEISYERGYCRPECTACSDVCPAGAIVPITKEEKTSISIGTATWIKDNCVVLTDDVSCGNCQSHCPTGAIHMVPYGQSKEESGRGHQHGKGDSKGKGHHGADSKMIPVVDVERCIGCGACEYVCPAAPFSAIYVEGKNRHTKI